MPTLATTTIDDGLIAAEFTVTEARNGDVVITRRVIGADVFRPDTFCVPADLRAWLAEVVAPAGPCRAASAAFLAALVAGCARFDLGEK